MYKQTAWIIVNVMQVKLWVNSATKKFDANPKHTVALHRCVVHRSGISA